MLKWTVAGRTDWFEASGVGRQTAGMAWPVRGGISSTFGLRVHPILRFARMHKGVDFKAPAGAARSSPPPTARWSAPAGPAAMASKSGWPTPAASSTSYSHMSRITAAPGSIVRQGQLIGYVGSTGLSTGPHLHYEVYRGGVAVNPLSVRFVTRSIWRAPNWKRSERGCGAI